MALGVWGGLGTWGQQGSVLLSVNEQFNGFSDIINASISENTSFSAALTEVFNGFSELSSVSVGQLWTEKQKHSTEWNVKEKVNTTWE